MSKETYYTSKRLAIRQKRPDIRQRRPVSWYETVTRDVRVGMWMCVLVYAFMCMGRGDVGRG